MSNRIHIKGDYRQEEVKAAGVIKPGHLCQIDSNGEVVVHATEGGFCERLVALEDALQGRTIDDAYADDELVTLGLFAPGSEAYMYLEAGSNVAIGAELVSTGDGALIESNEVASGVTVEQVVATSLEAKNLSASGAVDTLIKVRFR